MAEFQRFQEAPRFEPRAIIESASRVQKQGQQLVDSLQQQIRLSEENDRRRIENTKNVGAGLQALAPLSKTIGDLVTDIGQQTAKDIETGVLYDQMIGATPESYEAERLGDEAATEDARQQSLSNAAAADRAESQGKELEAEAIRRDPTGGAVGYRTMRADALEAQGAYSPFIQAYLENRNIKLRHRGDALAGMSVFEAANSGDPTLVDYAIKQAQYDFFKTFKGGVLMNATKNVVVNSLKGIIPNVNSSVAASKIQTSLKSQRDIAQGSHQDRVYSDTKSGYIGDPQTYLDNQLENAWLNGGYQSRAAANDATIKSMIQGYEDSGNSDGLRQLENLLKIRNQNGTEIGRTYGVEINDAIERADSNFEREQDDAAEDIVEVMYSQLRGMSPQDSDVIIDQTVTQLESMGRYKEAAELRRKKDSLRIDAAADANAAQMSQMIRDGELANTKAIDQAEAAGFISPEKADDLREELGELNDTEKPSDKTAAEIADDYNDRAATVFTQAVGLKRDAFGNLPDTYAGESVVIGSADAKIVLGAIERDVNAFTNKWLRNYEGPESEKSGKLASALEAWYERNLWTKGGKYYIGGLIDKNTGVRKDEPDPDNENYIKYKLITSPRYLNRTSSVAPDDFSAAWDSSTGLPQNAQSNFIKERRDTIFTKKQVEDFRKQYVEDGIIDGQLSLAASQLGTIPSGLAMLQHQLQSYGLEPVVPQSILQQATQTAAPKAQRITSVPFVGPVQATQYMVSQGLSRQGAALLMGQVLATTDPNDLNIANNTGILDALITMVKQDAAAYKAFTSEKWVSERQLKEAFSRVFQEKDLTKQFGYAQTILQQMQ